MKGLLRFLTIFAVLGLIASAVIFYFLTQQPDSAFTKRMIVPVVKPFVGFISGLSPHTNVDASEAAYLFSPDSLQQFFIVNASEATEKYAGKIIQVSGIVSDIATPTDTNIVVLLAIANDPLSNISCQMDPAFNERLQGVSSTAVVTIKGICSGAKQDDLLGSTDVLLNRCVLVQE